MKKKIKFLIVTIVFVLIGCDHSKNDSVIQQRDNLSDIVNGKYYSMNKISLAETDKIKTGLTIQTVIDILGPGTLGDPPVVCLIYSCKDGSSVSILFYEFQNKKIKYVGRVTGIYHYLNNSKGHFLLPNELKGKSWDEIMGEDW